MLWTSLISGLALAASVSAATVPASHVVHEQRGHLPNRWIKRDRVRSSSILPVRVGLAQSNLDNAHDYLMDVSHPSSPNYGKHWTAEEVIDAFKPSDETVAAVRQWLVDSGIPSKDITHSDNRGWLAFNVPAEHVESLLHTEYHEYEDRRTGGVMPGCERYHVPEHIREHVDYISPGIRLMAPSDEITEAGRENLKKRNVARDGTSTWSSASVEVPKPPRKFVQPDFPFPKDGLTSYNLSLCDVQITPACIAALYQIPPAYLADPGNSLGIFEAELQFWDQYDLNSFFTNFTFWIPNGTHPIDHDIDGGVAKVKNISLAGGESMLDLELAYPITYPQTITVWNVDDLKYQTWANDTYTWGFNTLLDAIDGSYCTYSAYGETGDLPGIDPTYPDPGPEGYNGTLQCGVYKPTNVFSLSYGGQEADVPISYQKRQCNEYLKLGLQGIPFFFASGDSGIGNYPDPYGFDGPTGCLGPDHNIFNPTWPNTCPYVTNVGATKVYPGHTVFEPESAVYDPAGYPYETNYSSGGGFSNIFPVPQYQKQAVDTYFAEHSPPYKYYSELAQVTGDPYSLLNVTALAGDTGGIYNRLGRGVPDVAANGDNIAVYVGGEFGLSGGTSASTPIFASIMNRINEERLAIGKSTVGFVNPVLYENPWALNDITNGTNPACFEGGFYAVKGWDPVTGLGTPNYPKLLALYLSLP